MSKYLKAAVLDLAKRRETLQMRIAVRKRAHRGHADLDIQLLAETMRQLRAERRWERQRGKAT